MLLSRLSAGSRFAWPGNPPLGEYTISYEPGFHVVVVRHDGPWDREQSNQNLAAIFEACEAHGTGRVLIDHRGTTLDLDTFTLFERGRELTEPDVLPPVKRMAFLPPAGKGDDYSFFVMVMRNRGMSVETFDDEASAYAWLASD